MHKYPTVSGLAGLVLATTLIVAGNTSLATNAAPPDRDASAFSSGDTSQRAGSPGADGTAGGPEGENAPPPRRSSAPSCARRP